MTEMSGFLEPRLKNFATFGRFLASVQFLLKWTFWSTLLCAGGCVVPVEPHFQDPPQAPNYYPYLSNADPIAQTAVTVQPAPGMLVFNVQVGDQNLDDTLYVRWVSDYPPYTNGLSKIVVDGPRASACRSRRQRRPPKSGSFHSTGHAAKGFHPAPVTRSPSSSPIARSSRRHRLK